MEVLTEDVAVRVIFVAGGETVNDHDYMVWRPANSVEAHDERHCLQGLPRAILYLFLLLRASGGAAACLKARESAREAIEDALFASLRLVSCGLFPAATFFGGPASRLARAAFACAVCAGSASWTSRLLL